MQPTELVACIRKCRNITKLHLYNCAINYAHIITILGKCTHLEDLYWSIEVQSCGPLNNDEKTYNNIKKICLQVPDTVNTIWVTTQLYAKCPNVKEFILNFSPCFVTSLPANSATKCFTFKPFTCLPFHVLMHCEAESFPEEMLKFIKRMSLLLRIEINDIDWMGMLFFYYYFMKAFKS